MGKLLRILPRIFVPGEALDGEEKWAPCSGFESYYFVSTHGRVMRVAGGNGTRMRAGVHLGRVISTRPNSKGYPIVNLWRNSVRATVKVHKLVGLAFLGPPPRDEYGEFQLHHKDADSTNNRATNLEWLTAKENREEEWHRYIHGKAVNCF